MRGIARGDSTREIAARLNLTEAALRARLRRMMAQLGVRNENELSAVAGTYRFRITAKRYSAVSRRFVVTPGAIVTPRVVGNAVELGYPRPFLLNDWTYRPLDASGGSVTFLIGRRRVVLRRRSATKFPIPLGSDVTIPAGGARDRYGNRNSLPVRVR